MYAKDGPTMLVQILKSLQGILSNPVAFFLSSWFKSQGKITLKENCSKTLLDRNLLEKFFFTFDRSGVHSMKSKIYWSLTRA